MLPVAVKKLLFNSIPTSFDVDGNTHSPKKTRGKFVLGEYSSPTINIAFIGDGTPYYTSIGDFEEIQNDTLVNRDVRTTIARYKVGANNTQANSTETITHSNGTTTYPLYHTPAIKINSIGPFVKGTDYNLANSEIEWIGSTPGDSEEFTVDYDYIEDGYWLTSSITDLLMKDILANLPKTLAEYKVDVQSVSRAHDISAIYSDEQVSALTFDVQLVYNYSWTRKLTDDDGPLIDSLDLEFAGETHTF